MEPEVGSGLKNLCGAERGFVYEMLNCASCGDVARTPNAATSLCSKMIPACSFPRPHPSSCRWPALCTVTAWRLRETRSAVSLKKIVIPPLGMATGFSMFFVHAFRIPWGWAGTAFMIGAIALAWPLLLTTRLIRTGDAIMMKRSSAFLVVLFALAAIRFLARGYLTRYSPCSSRPAYFSSWPSE